MVRRAVTALAVGGLLLAFAGTAVGNPAVNEYKLRLPDAKDKDRPEPANPAPSPPVVEDLPAPTVEKLHHNKKNGKALAAVATAPDLGAPDPVLQETDGHESLLGGLVRSLLDPLALMVLLGMAAIGFGAYRGRKADEDFRPRRPARVRTPGVRR
jgi:hypothetical protein